jgi:hypothetical protein
MNNPDHISKSLDICVKIFKFFDADPGYKNSDPVSGMEKKSDLGSKTSWIPDPPFSIQDTGYEIFHPGLASKNFNILTQMSKLLEI